ncbi:MAG: protein O-GlcNAcase [Oscillospiraceae bacterium]|nr:protein O-GlcNAcase [Oscillospiraceae bacterium]
MIHPILRKPGTAGNYSFGKPASISLNIDDKTLLQKREEIFGSKFVTDGDVVVTAVLNNTEKLCYIDEIFKLTDEKYILNISEHGGKVYIGLEYSGRRSLWYALNAVEKMAGRGEFPLGETVDYPLFDRRGFIEGFYGTTWQFEQRKDILTLMARNNMNTFYYAPKDDPYHRRLWAEMYPEDELQNLKILVDLAADLAIDFHYCVAPGLSIKYADADDHAALLEKTKQLYSIGVRNFGLLLDDIPSELANDEDKARFGDTVSAHIYLVNRYYDMIKSVDSGNRLTVCPMEYHGKGNGYYISKLGNGMPPEADLFWTGAKICSMEITLPEAVRFIDATSHRPLYWDNFPVNDAEMVNEMHLGPIIGRDPDLYKYTRGIISNCMEYFECTKIPLLTIADYLWNPLVYDSAKSYDNALDQIIGSENREIFKYFADHLKTSCLDDANSLMMSDLLGASAVKLQKGQYVEAFDDIKAYLENMKKCAELLKNGTEPIYKELKRWSGKFILCVEILELCVRFLEDGEDELEDKIKELDYKYNGDPTVLTGFCFKEFVMFAVYK